MRLSVEQEAAASPIAAASEASETIVEHEPAPPAAPGRSRRDAIDAWHHDHQRNHPVEHDAQVDALLDQIAIAASTSALNLIEKLPIACRGVVGRHQFAHDGVRLRGAVRGDGIEIINGTQAHLDFLRRNLGVMMVAVCGFLTSDNQIHVVDLRDAPPAAPSESDPPADWFPCLKRGESVRTGVGSVIAQLNSLCWLAGDIRRAESKFAEYSDVDLDQPAAKAGASFQSAWIRGASGQLFVARRGE